MWNTGCGDVAERAANSNNEVMIVGYVSCDASVEVLFFVIFRYCAQAFL